MTDYICKCGKIIHKSTEASVTGNKLDGYAPGHECFCCPYVVQQTRYIAYPEKETTYECEATKEVKTVTTTSGFRADKNNAYIYTLDFDFLRKVGQYCAENDYLETPRYCFDHKTSYNAKGDFTFGIMPTANKAGIAAKMALYEHFFNEHGTRKDTGGADEAETILAQIERDKAQARGEDMQVTEIENDVPDINVANITEPEETFVDVMGAEFIVETMRLKGRQAEDTLLWIGENKQDPDTVLNELCDAYEDCSMCPVKHICTVEPEKSILEYLYEEWHKRTDKHTETHACDLEAAETHEATISNSETVEPLQEVISNSETTTEETSATEPDHRSTLVASPLDAVSAALAPAFDYAALDEKTAGVLLAAENLIVEARRYYITECASAVGIAHDALCATVVAQCENGKFAKKEDTFLAWCDSVGLKKDTAYRFLQVNALMKGSTIEEQAILEQAPATLLYAAAKPSAPADLVQGVKDGDIKKHSEFQKLLKEKQDMEKEKQDAEERAKQAKSDFEVVSELITKKVSENARLKREAFDNVEHTKNLERKVQELETRPVEVAVQQPTEADIERYRKEGEEKARAALKLQIDAADNARKKKDIQLKALQERLNGKSDHLTAVEKELASTKDALSETTAKLQAQGRSATVAVVYCDECIYRKQNHCFGLDSDSVLDDKMKKEGAEVAFCSYGKRG